MKEKFDELISKLAERKMGIMICNQNDESQFIQTFREMGYDIDCKDETAYCDVDGQEQAIFPIAYCFCAAQDDDGSPGFIVVWDNDIDSLKSMDFFITGYQSFMLNMA